MITDTISLMKQSFELADDMWKVSEEVWIMELPTPLIYTNPVLPEI